MLKQWRVFPVLVLAFLLLAFVYPPSATAEEAGAFSLEQAIRLVKANFDIPQEYTNFTSNYDSYDGRQTWSLHWSAPSDGGSFHADVDARTGEIINMNTWRPAPEPGSSAGSPSVSLEAARQTAEELLNRLAARHVRELQLLPIDDQLIPLNNSGPPTYTFRWQRLVNGISFPADGATVTVRGDDGRVTNYSLNWTEADFPAAMGGITPEKARQVFAEAGMLELQYFLPAPVKPLAAGEKRPVLLVYRLSHPSQGLIDALSGQPLNLGNGAWFDSGGRSEVNLEMARKAAALQDGVPAKLLSPEELKEIEKTAKLISREEAVAAVKKWVDIPTGLTLRSANLYADWQDPEIRTWNLTWSSDSPENGKPGFMSARVNAINGELMGFDLPITSSGNDKEVKLDRQAARRLAEEFLQKVQPQRFKEVRLDENNPSGGAPTVQYFNYRRLVNGIPFSGNGINITVDAVAGRITSYNLNWGNFDFPAATGILDARQAVETFLQNRPLTLSYTRIYRPGSTDGGEIRLVYQPLGNSPFITSNMIDARTGQFLDWEGKPIGRQPRPYRFNDIAGNFAEKEISLLGQAGIFGEYKDAFHPDEKVTVVSLLRAMLMSRYGVWGYHDLKDGEILQRAREEKWLKENLEPGAAVSRELLAKFLIRYLNLERVARIEGIYRVPYRDSSSLNPETLGYAALAWGLGIIKGDGFTFDPAHDITRAEAAAALVRTLQVKQ
ncbi:YcdB/YcdC domain-containing protein [Neomoorella humiferrea]|uniref:Peptidase propeptide and YPEB domain protein n=1 Tax=Neomoorella humiferrea TaxID=676965 RepID=A0A2T0ASV4_9FIRM|nr:YcdB/YcdC domain-containing protein [Moorella humiferrea]PRR73319.1 Peptidase propeptide and YPEB domain protein [Moorella humiferrea]